MATNTNLQTLVVTISGNSSGFQGMVNLVQLQVNNLANHIAAQSNRMAESFAKAGRQMSLAFTLPIAAAGAAAIKVGADFDLGFAGVRKTVQATEQEFATLRQGFKDLADDIPVVVEDLLAIGQAAGQLKIQNKNIISFTETIGRLAVATNLGAEKGAITLARFANIVQMNQRLIPNLGAAIVGLGNTTASTEQEIASMAMRIAGAGNTVGLTIPQILGMSATLSSLGLKAEMGGTAISQTFLRIAEAVATGSEELDAFAKTAEMTIADFSALFEKDAMAAIMAMLKGMKKMGTSELVVALDAMGAEGVRIMDTLQRLAGAVNLLDDNVAKANIDFVANKELIRESDERFKAFWPSLQKTKNELKNLGEEGFKILEPLLRGFMGAVSETVGWLRQLDPTLQGILMVTAGLTASVGPLLLLIAGGVKLWAAMAFGLAAVKTGAIAAVAALKLYATAAMGAKIATAGFITMAGGIVAVLGHQFGKYLGDGINGLRDYNDEVTRSARLTNNLVQIGNKRHSGIMQEAMAIDNLGDRQKFLSQALEQADKDWKGSQVSASLARKEVDMFNGTWNRWTGNKVLAQAKTGLEEALASTDQYATKAQELRDALEEVTKEMEKRAKEERKVVDIKAAEETAKLKEKVDELTQSLQVQVDTFGMSSGEVQAYQLMMEGVAEADLQAALALSDQLEFLEKRNEELERQKELEEANEEFLDSLRQQVKTFNMSSREAELYRMATEGLAGADYRAAAALTKKLDQMDKEKEMMEEGKELTKEFLKPAEKFAARQKELQAMLKAGAINSKTYNAALTQLQKETKKDFGVNLDFKGGEGVAAGSAEAIARMMEFKAMAGQTSGIPAVKPVSEQMTAQAAVNAKSQALYAAQKGGGSTALKRSPEEMSKYLEQIAKNTSKSAKKENVVLNPVNFRGGT